MYTYSCIRHVQGSAQPGVQSPPGVSFITCPAAVPTNADSQPHVNRTSMANTRTPNGVRMEEPNCCCALHVSPVHPSHTKWSYDIAIRHMYLSTTNVSTMALCNQSFVWSRSPPFPCSASVLQVRWICAMLKYMCHNGIHPHVLHAQHELFTEGCLIGMLWCGQMSSGNYTTRGRGR
jgi:hypothetical protein